MAGPNSSVHSGQHREKEPPVLWPELRELQNLLVKAMERMFNEHLPMVGGWAPQQHSPTNSCSGLFGQSGHHDRGGCGRSFRPCVLLVMKIILCPPKEKFSKRHEEGPMDSKTHVRKSATNQN
jgi:hypothetical protein